MVYKDIEIVFTENLAEFFWNRKFGSALENAKTVSEKNQVAKNIMYDKNHLLYFTKDKKSILIRFEVLINDKKGVFSFLISLSEDVMKSDLNLNRGLCMINHDDFDKDVLYSLEGSYPENGNVIYVKTIKSYKSALEII